MAMKQHGLWMIIGCTLPLLLVFLLPIIGVSSNIGTFIFILLMFACHLMIMRGHGGSTDTRGGGHGGH